MTPPPWHVTDTVIVQYARLRRWYVVARGDKENNAYESMPEAVLVRVDEAIAGAQKRVRFKRRDRFGHEEWRDTNRIGSGIRFVIDPHVDGKRGELPKVIWVGQGVPPTRVFDADGSDAAVPASESVASAPVSVAPARRHTDAHSMPSEMKAPPSWAELPEWARAALAAGWTPPPGWKP